MVTSTPGGGTKAQAAGYGFYDGVFDDSGIMTQDHRAPGADVIDVAVAVHVIHAGTIRPLDEAGSAAHAAESANRRVNATGNKTAGLVKEFFRLGHAQNPWCL